MTVKEKTGILLVSFGTTYTDSKEKTIDAVAKSIQKAFPGIPLYQAFTSRMIRNVLKNRDGIEISDPGQALSVMHRDGIKNVWILPTHFLDGIENELLKDAVNEVRDRFENIIIAHALTQTEEDEMRTAEAIWESLCDRVGNNVLVLMGHGTSVEADRCYSHMQNILQTKYHKDVFVATVEGKITIEDVIGQMKNRGITGGKVIVTPMMLVAGDHANNDMAGEDNSFVTKLKDAGYDPVPVIRGLGEYEPIRKLYAAQLLREVSHTLYGIGTGPGDPELVTEKALHALERVHTVIVPNAPKEKSFAYRIMKQSCPEIEKKKILALDFPMTRDKNEMERKLDLLYEKIKDTLFEGDTAFLTIGDPTVYSTFQYMKNRFEAEGGCTETVNGIPSFTAAAARLGISLGDGPGEIHIIPSKTDNLTALSYPGTKIFMKSGKRLAALLDILKKEKRFEVKGVSDCGMETERLYHSLEEVILDAPYLTILIVKDKKENTSDLRHTSEKRGNSFYYYENRECKYYPCHNSEHVNCLFCYCPLYHMDDCPGEYYMKEIRGKQVKVCSDCLFPHERKNYKEVLERLRP